MFISGISPSIINVPSVAVLISSTETPGARSMSLKPSLAQRRAQPNQ